MRGRATQYQQSTRSRTRQVLFTLHPPEFGSCINGTVDGTIASCVGDRACGGSNITGCESVICDSGDAGFNACFGAKIGNAGAPIAGAVDCVGGAACNEAMIFGESTVNCNGTSACFEADIGSADTPIGGAVDCVGSDACNRAMIHAQSGSCSGASNACRLADFFTLFMSMCESDPCTVDDEDRCDWTDRSDPSSPAVLCDMATESNAPSTMPSNMPSSTPSNMPSSTPSNMPSSSSMPSSSPSNMPSNMPSTSPSTSPSTPPTESSTSPSSCLSPETVVVVVNKGPTRIAEVKVGDRVECGKNKSALVISRGHFNHQPIREFLQIHTTDGSQPLEVTKEHLVFILARRGVRNWRSDDDDGDGKAVSEDHIVAVPAKEVVVGDYVLSKDGATLQVTAITSVERQGVYSPFTTTGTIVANGVLVSNYAVVDEMETLLWLGDRILHIPYQTMAHAALAHARVLCALDFSLCLEEGREGSWAQSAMEQNGGITPWALPYTWLLDQHVIVKYAGFVLIAPLVLISYGLELVSVSQETGVLQVVAAAAATAAALIMAWWIVQAKLAHKENKNSGSPCEEE